MTVTRGTRWIALVLTVLAVGVITLAMVGTLAVTYRPWRFVASYRSNASRGRH